MDELGGRLEQALSAGDISEYVAASEATADALQRVANPSELDEFAEKYLHVLCTVGGKTERSAEAASRAVRALADGCHPRDTMPLFFDALQLAVSRSTAAAEEAETEEEEDAGWAVCGALVSGVCSLSRRVTRRQLPYALECARAILDATRSASAGVHSAEVEGAAAPTTGRAALLVSAAEIAPVIGDFAKAENSAGRAVPLEEVQMTLLHLAAALSADCVSFGSLSAKAAASLLVPCASALSAATGSDTQERLWAHLCRAWDDATLRKATAAVQEAEQAGGAGSDDSDSEERERAARAERARGVPAAAMGAASIARSWVCAPEAWAPFAEWSPSEQLPLGRLMEDCCNASKTLLMPTSPAAKAYACELLDTVAATAKRRRDGAGAKAGEEGPSQRAVTGCLRMLMDAMATCPVPDVKQGAYSSLKRVLGLVGPFTRIGVLEELMESAQDDAVAAILCTVAKDEVVAAWPSPTALPAVESPFVGPRLANIFIGQLEEAMTESRKLGGPHVSLDRSIAASNGLRFLLMRDAASGANVTGLMEGPSRTRLETVVRELGTAATLAAAAAAEGGGDANDEDVGLDRVLGLQALAEVAARLLEAFGGGTGAAASQAVASAS